MLTHPTICLNSYPYMQPRIITSVEKLFFFSSFVTIDHTFIILKKRAIESGFQLQSFISIDKIPYKPIINQTLIKYNHVFLLVQGYFLEYF